MKKFSFVMVMVAALSLMFVSCKTTPASTSNTSESVIEEVDSTVTEVSQSVEVEKPSKPEVKEDVDVTTPATPTEEANKPIGNKK
jgi:uncharacterized lipoprotein YajG